MLHRFGQPRFNGVVKDMKLFSRQESVHAASVFDSEMRRPVCGSVLDLEGELRSKISAGEK